MLQTQISYWQVFRLIFVVFSLYLMGDAFYRWDGFRYYASFSEFLPSVALIAILWTIVAIFTALLIWLPVRALKWFCLRIGWKLKTEHLLFFIGTFLLLGVIIWAGKRFIWPNIPTYDIPVMLRLIVFLFVTLSTIFLTWLFRNKAELWIDIIQDRMTPLVWLFGILVVLSIPLVAYHTLVRQTDSVESQKISQSFVSDKDRPNIILVTFDALTARNMSVYGYHRPTTPFIIEWVKTATLFTRAEAESNITTPTIASLMTGKRLWTHQTYQVPITSKPVKGDIENLALLLKDNSYVTMAFVVNRLASVTTLGITKSFVIAPPDTEFMITTSLFEIIEVLLYKLFGDKIKLYDWLLKWDFVSGKFVRALSIDFTKTQVPTEKAFNRFLSVIDNNPSEPFFAWIHLFPPHDPYLPSEPYMGMFDSSTKLRSFKSQEKGVMSTFKYRFKYQNFPQEVQSSVDTLRARYDEFIRNCDNEFKDFITQLAKRDKLKNTVIILSSDHGESFEHNHIKHGGTYLYEQLTHIPLIIKEPGQRVGRVVHDVIEQIDIAPTILDLAHIPVPSWMEGRSLLPLMRGKKLLPKPAFSMALGRQSSRGHEITKGTIAVWEGDYKLIHYLEGKKSLLFNLKKDPDELQNLFDREPEIGKHLLILIHENLKKANERIKKGEY